MRSLQTRFGLSLACRWTNGLDIKLDQLDHQKSSKQIVQLSATEAHFDCGKRPQLLTAIESVFNLQVCK